MKPPDSKSIGIVPGKVLSRKEKWTFTVFVFGTERIVNRSYDSYKDAEDAMYNLCGVNKDDV